MFSLFRVKRINRFIFVIFLTQVLFIQRGFGTSLLNRVQLFGSEYKNELVLGALIAASIVINSVKRKIAKGRAQEHLARVRVQAERLKIEGSPISRDYGLITIEDLKQISDKNQSWMKDIIDPEKVLCLSYDHNKNRQVVIFPECKHVLCRECEKRLPKKECPFCRMPYKNVWLVTLDQAVTNFK